MTAADTYWAEMRPVHRQRRHSTSARRRGQPPPMIMRLSIVIERTGGHHRTRSVYRRSDDPHHRPLVRTCCINISRPVRIGGRVGVSHRLAGCSGFKVAYSELVERLPVDYRGVNPGVGDAGQVPPPR